MTVPPLPPRIEYVYVASSWRNEIQPAVVTRLRAAGFEVYDFRNPPGKSGFSWAEIDPDWQTWSVSKYIQALEHPRAREGFAEDMHHLSRADATVCVLPSGRSAHLELGYAVAARQFTAVLLEPESEPELMYAACDFLTSDLETLVGALNAGARSYE